MIIGDGRSVEGLIGCGENRDTDCTYDIVQYINTVFNDFYISFFIWYYFKIEIQFKKLLLLKLNEFENLCCFIQSISDSFWSEHSCFVICCFMRCGVCSVVSMYRMYGWNERQMDSSRYCILNFSESFPLSLNHADDECVYLFCWCLLYPPTANT